MQIKPKKSWMLIWNVNDNSVMFQGKSPKVIAIGGVQAYFEAKTKTEIEEKMNELKGVQNESNKITRT